MSHPALYDEDILLWSEQQAELIRRLGATSRDLPNDLDVENVAEEIESVGRSEMASVESFLRLLLLHLIKIASVPTSSANAHWRDEARNFAAEALTRFAPSMAERVDLDRAWRLACRQATASLAEHGDVVVTLPTTCPWTVEQLIREPLDLEPLLARLEADRHAAVETN
jgi:Domain of unknown function DUF29